MSDSGRKTGRKRGRPKKGADPFAAEAGPTVTVRCLGPGREHTFPSRDRSRNRVCAACRAKSFDAHRTRLLDWELLNGGRK